MPHAAQPLTPHASTNALRCAARHVTDAEGDLNSVAHQLAHAFHLRSGYRTPLHANWGCLE